MPTPQLPPHVKSVVIALDSAGYQKFMAHLQGNSSTSLQQLLANTYHDTQAQPVSTSSAPAQQPKKKRSVNSFVAFRCK